MDKRKSWIVMMVILTAVNMGVMLGITTTIIYARYFEEQPVDRSLSFFDDKVLHWNCKSLPLTVVIDQKLPENYVKGITSAIDLLEKKVGRNVFDIEFSDSPTKIKGIKEVNEGYVIVTGAERLKNGYVGITYFNIIVGEYSRVASASIVFLLGEENIKPTAIHEFMHVLGFEHDSDKKSIMYPSIIGNTQVLTKHDSSWLKFLYGRDSCIKRSWSYEEDKTP